MLATKNFTSYQAPWNTQLNICCSFETHRPLRDNERSGFLHQILTLSPRWKSMMIVAVQRGNSLLRKWKVPQISVRVFLWRWKLWRPMDQDTLITSEFLKDGSCLGGSLHFSSFGLGLSNFHHSAGTLPFPYVTLKEFQVNITSRPLPSGLCFVGDFVFTNNSVPRKYDV